MKITIDLEEGRDFGDSVKYSDLLSFVFTGTTALFLVVFWLFGAAGGGFPEAGAVEGRHFMWAGGGYAMCFTGGLLGCRDPGETDLAGGQYRMALLTLPLAGLTFEAAPLLEASPAILAMALGLGGVWDGGAARFLWRARRRELARARSLERAP